MCVYCFDDDDDDDDDDGGDDDDDLQTIDQTANIGDE